MNGAHTDRERLNFQATLRELDTAELRDALTNTRKLLNTNRAAKCSALTEAYLIEDMQDISAELKRRQQGQTSETVKAIQEMLESNPWH